MKRFTIGATRSAAGATFHPDHHHALATALHFSLHPLAVGPARVAASIAAWRARREERRALFAMSEPELRDLGITRNDIPNVMANRYTRES